MGDLFDWALSSVQGSERWHTSKPLPWREEKARFFATLKAFDDYLASDAPLHAAAEPLFQGPIADALTHAGAACACSDALSPDRQPGGENFFVATTSPQARSCRRQSATRCAAVPAVSLQAIYRMKGRIGREFSPCTARILLPNRTASNFSSRERESRFQSQKRQRPQPAEATPCGLGETCRSSNMPSMDKRKWDFAASDIAPLPDQLVILAFQSRFKPPLLVQVARSHPDQHHRRRSKDHRSNQRRGRLLKPHRPHKRPDAGKAQHHQHDSPTRHRRALYLLLAPEARF